MTAPVTSTASDQALADALRANPGLTGMAEGAAHTARARAGRSSSFLDLRPFVAQTWDLVTWNEAPLSPVGDLRRWMRVAETMRAIAGLSDGHALALSAYPALDLPMNGGPAVQESVRKQVALNRAAALASNPSLAGLAALGERRAAAMRAAYAVQAAQEAAAYPGVLLADLRERGVSLAVLDGTLVAPVGVGALLTPLDRAAVAEHKQALVALLMAERGRPTVCVIA